MVCHAFGERLNHGTNIIGTVKANRIRHPSMDEFVFV